MTATRTQRLNPPGAPPALRPYYANAVRVGAGDLLFISGQVAWDARGVVVGRGDPVRQAEQVFANIATILGAHGATFDDVVKVTVFVTVVRAAQQPAGAVVHVDTTGEHDRPGGLARRPRSVDRGGGDRRCRVARGQQAGR